ncbi:MAG: hypothetical protein WCO06_02765 [Candidatus Roizmanbacteria bacterium]
MIKKYSVLLVFSMILFISIFFRIYQLGDVPHGLHNDEVANAYGTKFILMNGVDIYGNRWPLFYFDKFGDYPPVLPMYLSGIGAYIFGPTVFGARFFIALTGALLVIPVFFISLYIFRRKITALFTSFTIAILPALIITSRLSAEGIVAVTVYITALLLLLLAHKQKHIGLLILSSLLFFLTYLLYPSFRITTPLTFVGGLLLFKKSDIKSKYCYSYLTMLVLSFILMLAITNTHWGKGRFAQTSIFNVVSGVQILIDQLTFNENNIYIARIFNNKFLGYSRELLFQYFSYFSPNYLFMNDSKPLAYQVPNSSLTYITLLLLILISSLTYFQSKNKLVDYRLFIFIIWILLISPLSASLTVIDVPNMHRALLQFVMIVFVASYGFNSLLYIKWRNIPFYIIPIILILFECVIFTHNYFQHASVYTSVYRNDGNMEAAQIIQRDKHKYKTIYVSNQERWMPLYFLYFSNNYNRSLIGKFQIPDFKISEINTIHFPQIVCPSNEVFNAYIQKLDLSIYENNMFVDVSECKDSYSKEKMSLFNKPIVIQRVNETDAFHILTTKSNLNLIREENKILSK